MPHHKTLSPDTLTPEALDNFLSEGWYRMCNDIFTTTHTISRADNDLREVWWLRFPVQAIPERKSHRRMRRRNEALQLRYVERNLPIDAYEALYERYHAHLPFEGYPSVRGALGYVDEDAGIYDTRGVELWDGDRLAAAGLFDVGAKAAMSILHFYDPAYASMSPGKYLILLTLDYLKERGFQWYYPGYVVSGVPRFDYKLFLGEDVAQYFDPADQSWKPYDPSILAVRPMTEEEREEFFWQFY